MLPLDFDFYPFEKKEADYNMAFDELLYNFAYYKNANSFRLYTWSRPSISIGLFQKISNIDLKKCIKNGIRVVRRLTGGRAVFHYNELTYACAFPINAKSFSKKELFLSFSKVILAGIKSIGKNSVISSQNFGDLRNVSCFDSHVLYEIVDLQGNKLVGTAMLVKNNTVLIQGSIPLGNCYLNIDYFIRNSPNYNKAFSTIDYLNKLDFKLISDFIIGIKSKINLNLADKLTISDIDCISRLLKDKYSNDSWLNNR